MELRPLREPVIQVQILGLDRADNVNDTKHVARTYFYVFGVMYTLLLLRVAIIPISN